MKRNIKSLLIFLLTLAIIFTAAGPTIADSVTINMPATIYESVERTNIASGASYEKIMRFTTAGWWNINVLRINLQDPYVEVKGLYDSDYVTNRSKVSSLVEKNDAVAGINGDFFYFNRFTGPVGSLIEDGDLVVVPRDSIHEKLPGFFIDALNQANIMDLFKWEISAANKTAGKTVKVNAVNNIYGDFNAIVMLNRHWGEKTPGNTYVADLTEVTINNGVVTNVRTGDKPIEIPENGYVLVANGEKAKELLEFSIGDKVELNISSNPDINKIKFAIGGGNVILNNGEYVSLDPSSAGDPRGNHPRTGIGISEDKKEIILVTIDGRDTSFKGVSQPMFGAILKELGAHNAINLDGGGSTTMAVKPLGEDKATVVNKPSDGAERPVINGVGVFSNAPKGSLSSIEVSTDDTNMFVVTSRNLTVKGYDKYYNPVEIDESKIQFKVEGIKGDFLGNKFKALSKGNAKIIAKYGDIEASMDLKVLDNVKDISTSISSFKIDINSERALPTFYGINDNGYKAKIYPEDIQFTTVKDIGYVENNTFHSGKVPIAGALTAKFGDGIRNILVYVGDYGRLLQGFETLDNLKFAVYPKEVAGEIVITDEPKEGRFSAILKYDFSKGENSRAAYIKLMNEDEPGLPIEGIPKELGLWVKGDNMGSWLRGTIRDAKGDSHKIEFAKTVNWEGWKYLTVDLPANMTYPIALEEIYIVETDTLKRHSGEVIIDGLTALYTPEIGNIVLPTPSTLKDSKNVKAKVEKNGFSFGVIGEPKNLNELVNYDALAKVVSKANEHETVVFLNSISEEFNEAITSPTKIKASGDYNKTKKGDLTFLYVNTEKGGIRATNSDQWNLLKEHLNSEDKNIVVFFSSPIFNPGGFTDQLEADLLHKYLVEASEKGKNIFVVYGGNANTLELKDGIRYIGLKTKGLTEAEEIYDISIVEFVVNGSNITYEIKQIFDSPNVKVSP
ncbi:MAG: phosphodiester glycosidase family protein [Tissierellia bacterium]|nr:phosphodiester glycosidase family protein [Tissierellia bacterium]